MAKYVKADPEGNIVCYGNIAPTTMNRMIDEGERIITVLTLFPNMDVAYKIDENDELVKKA